MSRQREPIEKVERGLNRHGGQLVNRMIANEDMTRAGSQPAPLTVFTWLGVEVTGEFFTNRVGFRVPVTAFHVRYHTFEGVRPPPRPPSVRTQVTEADLFFSAAVQNDVPNLFRQAPERFFNIKVVVVSETVQHLEVKRITSIPA